MLGLPPKTEIGLHAIEESADTPPIVTAAGVIETVWLEPEAVAPKSALRLTSIEVAPADRLRIREATIPLAIIVEFIPVTRQV